MGFSMSFFRKLFGRREEDNASANEKSFAIPAPDGWPGGARIQPPKKRGKTNEQYEKECNEYFTKVESKKQAIAKFNRGRAVAAGVKYYLWKSSKNHGCTICAKREGRKYAYSKPTSDGYPGEGKCGSGTFCHAWAKPVINL